jgi:hypothetical protein
MKVGRRSRLVLQLTMWAVIGVTLVAIPALVSTNAHNPAPTTDNIRTTNPGASVITTSTGSIQIVSSSASESWNLGDFLLRLSLVLTLAVGLSGLLMFRLKRKFRKRVS